MNRLYWLSAEGHWALVVEDLLEWPIQEEALNRVQTSGVYGVVGFAKYPPAPPEMRWTAYIRHVGGSTRKPWPQDKVPKPIQLLEMLHAPDVPE